MKISKALILLVSLILASTSIILAQDGPSAAQTAEQLRAQLRDVQSEEAEVQARVQELDWELRPENIERYFVGTGSTRPEELREQRRRLLQNEKDRAQARLEQLVASRTRLESDIIMADAMAYQQSAHEPPAVWVNRMMGAHFVTNGRLVMAGSALIIMLGGLLIVVLIRRRKHLAA